MSYDVIWDTERDLLLQTTLIHARCMLSEKKKILASHVSDPRVKGGLYRGVATDQMALPMVRGQGSGGLSRFIQCEYERWPELCAPHELA